MKAVVQPAPGVEGSDELAAELIGYVRARLAGYKTPRSLDFIDELPRLPPASSSRVTSGTATGGCRREAPGLPLLRDPRRDRGRGRSGPVAGTDEVLIEVTAANVASSTG